MQNANYILMLCVFIRTLDTRYIMIIAIVIIHHHHHHHPPPPHHHHHHHHHPVYWATSYRKTPPKHARFLFTSFYIFVLSTFCRLFRYFVAVVVLYSGGAGLERGLNLGFLGC